VGEKAIEVKMAEHYRGAEALKYRSSITALALCLVVDSALSSVAWWSQGQLEHGPDRQ
jgi:hypothetical protein